MYNVCFMYKEHCQYSFLCNPVLPQVYLPQFSNVRPFCHNLCLQKHVPLKIPIISTLKVKFFLYLMHYAVSCMVEWREAPHILTDDTGWRWVGSFIAQPLYLWGSPQYLLYEMVDSSQSWSRYGVQGKSVCLCQGWKRSSLVFQPITLSLLTFTLLVMKAIYIELRQD